MNLRRAYVGFEPSPAVLASLSRIEALWRAARAASGADGPWLFGAYSLADVFFAPVAARIATYGLPAAPRQRPTSPRISPTPPSSTGVPKASPTPSSSPTTTSTCLSGPGRDRRVNQNATATGQGSPMVAHAYTVAFQGVEARLSRCSAPSPPALPASTSSACPTRRSPRPERVRAALTAMGLALPAQRITVNLSPADLPKEGSHFDLPIALARAGRHGRAAARRGRAAVGAGRAGAGRRASRRSPARCRRRWRRPSAGWG